MTLLSKLLSDVGRVMILWPAAHTDRLFFSFFAFILHAGDVAPGCLKGDFVVVVVVSSESY